MKITAYFQSSGTPATGLAPTIVVRNVETGLVVVNGAAMTEVGSGFYSYDFASYSSTYDYVYICDSVALSGSERYAVGGTTVENQLTDIKIKTDTIPANPALVGSAMTLTSAYDAAKTAASAAAVAAIPTTPLLAANYTAPDNASILAIKAKTQNLPIDPASETNVSTRLATADYVAPDNADIQAIRPQTDQLNFDGELVLAEVGNITNVTGSAG